MFDNKPQLGLDNPTPSLEECLSNIRTCFMRQAQMQTEMYSDIQKQQIRNAALEEAIAESDKVANGILVWMESEEANYSAQELRAMAKKARRYLLAIRALKGGTDRTPKDED